MKEYLNRLYKKGMDLIYPNYIGNKKLAEYEELKKFKKLEGKCISEIHELLGIKKESKEF